MGPTWSGERDAAHGLVVVQQGVAALRQGSRARVQQVQGLLVDAQLLAAGNLRRHEQAVGLALVAQVGQNVASAGGPLRELVQQAVVVAGRSGVVHAPGAHRRDPYRLPVRGGEDLDDPTVRLALARAPQVHPRRRSQRAQSLLLPRGAWDGVRDTGFARVSRRPP